MFKDKSFDYVTFIDALHHFTIKEQINYLNEARRIAKKQIIILEDAKDLMSYFLEVATNRPSMPKNFTHKTEREWIIFFYQLGFDVIIIPFRRPFYYPLRHQIFILDVKPVL